MGNESKVQVDPSLFPRLVAFYYKVMNGFYGQVWQGDNVHGTYTNPGENISLQEGQDRMTAVVTQPILDQLKNFVPTKEQLRFRLLDVGCGRGAPAAYMAQQECEVTAINISRAQLETGLGHTSENQGIPATLTLSDGTFLTNSVEPISEYQGRIEFREQDAHTLGDETEQYDAAMCIEAIFHMDAKTVIPGIAASLKPGATFVGSFADFTAEGFDLAVMKGGFAAKEFLNPDKFTQLLEDSGFVDVVIHDITPYTYASLDLTLEELKKPEIREKLLEEYGKFGGNALLAGMDLFWPQVSRICKEHLQYYTFSARKQS